MGGVRYANIGIAVGTVYVLVGVLLFRGASNGVIQAIGLSGFLLGGIVYRGLDERARRRREASGRRSDGQ